MSSRLELLGALAVIVDAAERGKQWIRTIDGDTIEAVPFEILLDAFRRVREEAGLDDT